MSQLLLTIEPPREPAIAVAKLPEGDPGIERTIAAMRRVVADAARSPLVHGVARQLATLGPSDRFPWRLDDFLRAGVVYADDPPGEERLRMPETLIDQIGRDGKARADCDDLAMLGAAVLRAAGYSPVFIVVGRRPLSLKGRLEHVYYGFMLNPSASPTPQNVVPFDPQERRTPGVWADPYARVRIHRVYA